MRRITKSFAVALVLTAVLVMSIAGTALAGNNPDSTGNGKQNQKSVGNGERVRDGESIENNYFYNYNYNYSYNYEWSGDKEQGPHMEQQRGKPVLE